MLEKNKLSKAAKLRVLAIFVISYTLIGIILGSAITNPYTTETSLQLSILAIVIMLIILISGIKAIINYDNAQTYLNNNSTIPIEDKRSSLSVFMNTKSN